MCVSYQSAPWRLSTYQGKRTVELTKPRMKHGKTLSNSSIPYFKIDSQDSTLSICHWALWRLTSLVRRLFSRDMPYPRSSLGSSTSTSETLPSRTETPSQKTFLFGSGTFAGSTSSWQTLDCRTRESSSRPSAAPSCTWLRRATPARLWPCTARTSTSGRQVFCCFG